VDETALYQHFAQFGGVVNAQVSVSPGGGYGQVTFSSIPQQRAKPMNQAPACTPPPPPFRPSPPVPPPESLPDKLLWAHTPCPWAHARR
jgi:hypothetical protein